MSFIAHMHKIIQLKTDLNRSKNQNKRNNEPNREITISDDKKCNQSQKESLTKMISADAAFLFYFFSGDIAHSLRYLFEFLPLPSVHPTIPIKYTTEKINTQTTSIKCQYRLAT